MEAPRDVIVIGAGGAGLQAAISARRNGARTLLVSKGSIGKSSCTTFSGGFFSAGVQGMTVEEHESKTFEIGERIASSLLVSVLAKQAPHIQRILMEYGINLTALPGGFILERKDQRVSPRGVDMTLAMTRYAAEQGVELLSGFFANRIITDDAGVSGVELVETRSGKTMIVGAGALVVATGGAGKVFGRSDNTAHSTGDGINLLYKAGIALRDMEFVQFYPLGFDQDHFPKWFLELSIIDDVPLRNSLGEEFLREHFIQWGIASAHEANITARDKAAHVVAREIAMGRSVTLHLEALPKQKWDSLYYRSIRKLYPSHRPPEKGPVRVSPIQHFTCGGVVINEKGETSIPGLYACGEVTGGIHGAGRMGGNALSEAVVFGNIAGEGAAIRALSRQQKRGTTNGICTTACHPMKRMYSPSLLKKEVNRIADLFLGPIRTGAGLLNALKQLQIISEQATELSILSYRDVKTAYEARNMLQLALLMTNAALAREESRGVHIREDFPNTIHQYTGSFVWTRECGKDKMTFETTL